MIRAIRLVHLEADDLTAVHIQDEVEVKPLPQNLTSKESEIPTPQLSGSCGHMCTWCPHPLGRSRAASMPQLSVRAKHTAEAGLTGDIDPFVGKHRHDPRWRQLCKPRLVGDLQDPLSLPISEGMPRRRANRS